MIKNIFAVILGILLLVSMFGFIVTNSFSNTFNEEEFDSIIDDTADSIVEDGRLDRSTGEIYSQVEEQCDENNTAILGEGFDIECSEVEDITSEEFSEVLKDQISEEIKEQDEVNNIYSLLSNVKNISLILGIISAVLIASILLISFSFGMIIIGIVGLILGIPLVIVSLVKDSVKGILTQGQIYGVEEISTLFDNFFSLLTTYFVASLIVGIIIIIVGVIIYKRKKKVK